MPQKPWGSISSPQSGRRMSERHGSAFQEGKGFEILREVAKSKAEMVGALLIDTRGDTRYKMGHNYKEENISLATEAASKTRMSWTRIDKYVDRAARVKRGFCAWFKVKRYLRKSKLTSRTEEIIVQAT